MDASTSPQDKPHWRIQALLLMRLISRVGRDNPLGACVNLIVALFGGILPVIQTWVLGNLLDALVSAQSGGSGTGFATTLGWPIAWYVACLLVATILPAISSFVEAAYSQNLALHTQLHSLKKIADIENLGLFEEQGFHDELRVAIEGAQSSSTMIVFTVLSMFRSCIQLLTTTVLIYRLAPALAAGMAILVPIVATIRSRAAKHKLFMIQELSPFERRAYYLTKLLTERNYLKEIKLFGLFPMLFENLKELTVAKLIQKRLRFRRREISLDMAASLLELVVLGGVLIMSIQGLLAGEESIGGLAVLLGLVAGAQATLFNISMAWSGLVEASLHQEREMSFDARMRTVDRASIGPYRDHVPPLRRTIVLDHVWFRYSEGESWVLQDICVTIEAGKFMAIVGENGAGKTTFLMLVLGLFRPTRGRILWDGTDISEYRSPDYWARCSAAFQDGIHFSDSVYNNIAYGDPVHVFDSERVFRAANSAGADELIRELPDRFDTVLDKTWSLAHAIDLSIGQWQKLVLSRMFMRRAELFGIDEPTKALDALSEGVVWRSIRSLTPRHTVVVVSHSPASFLMADNILILRGGCVEAIGDYEGLRCADGYSARFILSMENSQPLPGDVSAN